MADPRFFFPNFRSPDCTVELDSEQAHHALKVLRLGEGDAVELFDGQGRVAGGRIDSARGGLAVRIREIRQTVVPKPGIDLAAAIPKGPRADEMVQLLSQLGVNRLICLRSERAVVEPSPGRLERFDRIALESAKQCRRAHLLQIAPPADLAAVLACDYDLRLIAQVGADPIDHLAAQLRRTGRVLIVVGPEGGFTDAELKLARQKGALGWCLGPNVLRIECAAAAAVAVARYLSTQ